jgi:hypothetical protein
MGLLPHELVRAHLNLDASTLAALSEDKPVLVAGERPHRALAALPDWPAATIAILSTLDGVPHAIPVTAPVRAGSARILFALQRGRGSLSRLLEHPEVALFIGAGDDLAFTARGRAHVVQERIPASPDYAAVALEVERIDDHRQPPFTVEAGLQVHWEDERAHAQAQAREAALRELAAAQDAA